MRHPVIAVVIALVILVSASLPYFDMKTGQAGVESLPQSDVKTAFEILERDFYVGVISPVEIVIDGNANDPAVAERIDTLVAELRTDAEYGPATVTTNDAGDLTLVSTPLATDANSQVSYDAVANLRESIVPSVFNGTDAEVYVSGVTAFNADFNTLIDDYTPIVFAFVLGLSFLLLMLAFRSLIVPIKAIIMNLLSVGAAYGLLVLVFQKGYGADFFGFNQVATIESWLPIFLFCVLFGLSMDYHVFLLSRIREHYDGTGRNRESVAVGLHSTAKIITGAALIMVAVFAGFSMGKLSMMQQMGFGLAVAVFLDATIVRSVLVPASMALLGNLNWYLPRWLHWLPDLLVEGAPVHQPVPVEVPIAAGGGDD
jgi:RND superfamily putative drug exporter